MRSFQYKILNHAPFVDKKTHIFGTNSSLLCSSLSVIYMMKQLFTYFMNVTMLNVYGQT